MTKKPRDPLAEALDALDLIGSLDAFIKTFLRSDQFADENVGVRLRAARWFQRQADAERRRAVRKLVKALDPIPFPKLPASLGWIRGEGAAPCRISTADRQALFDQIGPNIYARDEEG